MIEMVGIGRSRDSLVIKAMGGPQALLAWVAGRCWRFSRLVWSELGAPCRWPAAATYFCAKRMVRAVRPDDGRSVRLATLIQAPLAGFGRDRLFPVCVVPSSVGKYGEKAVSGRGVVLVALLYRRITSIGKISMLLWVGVVGTILWLIWAGPRISIHGWCHVWPRTGNFPAFLAGWARHGQQIYTLLGYYNICTSAARFASRRNIPRGIFHFDCGNCCALSVMQTCILGVLPWQQAQDSPFHVSAFVETYGPFAACLRR